MSKRNEPNREQGKRVGFVLHLTTLLRRLYSVGDEVWRIGGMILTGGNQSIGREPCLSVTLSSTNGTRTGLISNQDLRSARPASDRLSHGKASKKTLSSSTCHCSLVAGYIHLQGREISGLNRTLSTQAQHTIESDYCQVICQHVVACGRRRDSPTPPLHKSVLYIRNA